MELQKVSELYDKILYYQLQLLKLQLRKNSPDTLFNEIKETEKIKDKRNACLEKLNKMGLYVNFVDFEVGLL